MTCNERYGDYFSIKERADESLKELGKENCEKNVTACDGRWHYIFNAQKIKGDSAFFVGTVVTGICPESQEWMKRNSGKPNWTHPSLEYKNET